MNEGYSKRPLGKKLGLKPGYKIVLFNIPDHYYDIVHFWPEGMEIVERPTRETIDFIHLFCTERTQLDEALRNLLPALKKDGMLWVSWPKGGSTIKTDLNRDRIREALLSNTNLVDVKVAAVDADWSGLKFMYRRTTR